MTDEKDEIQFKDKDILAIVKSLETTSIKEEQHNPPEALSCLSQLQVA